MFVILQQNYNKRMIVIQSPNEQQLNGPKETLYCISKSYEHMENAKKQRFMSKLNFQYSLEKINKEKFYGNIIHSASKMYPQIYSEGEKYAAQQYSSAKIRQNRRSYIRYKAQPMPEHKESIKKYHHILSKTKRNQGGLDSFWMFKKQAQLKEKNKGSKNNQNSSTQAADQSHSKKAPNKMEQSFIKILVFGKMAPDLSNGLVSKNLLKNYMTTTFGQTFSMWFISFYQIKNYINFKEFEGLGEKMKNISNRQSHLISFFLYDQNGDGFIDPRDVFAVFQKQLNPNIEKDVLLIARFVKKNEGKNEQINEKFKIQHLVVRDDWLTIKDYEMFFKKVDQPYLKATNKKDTVFSKTFAVLDHRQKIRSTRKQISQKLTMYNQLFGAITKMKKNWAFIDQDDYKLNYTFFYEVFGEEKTEVFKYFADFLFGI